MIDNDYSQIIKKHLIKQEFKLKLASPYVHIINAAHAAKIIRNRFIDQLSSLDPTFSMYLWYRLIQLATKTLNLPRTARINPRILAQEMLNGFFYYNRIP